MLTKLFEDLKESAETAYRLFRPKEPPITTSEPVSNVEVEEEEEDEPPFGDAFVTMTETNPDEDTFYILTLKADRLDQEISFFCTWDEWSEIHEASPYSLVTSTLNSTNRLDDTELDAETITEWALQYGPEYAGTMLWVLVMKHDNYYELGAYGLRLGGIEKDKITCRFNDLPDQKALLN